MLGRNAKGRTPEESGSRRIGRVIAAGAVALAAASAAPVAAFAADAVGLEGPNVVAYTPDLPFISSTDAVVQGSRSDNGDCTFTGQIETTDEAASVGSEEAAFDPDTCQSVMRTGPLPEATTLSASAATARKRKEPRARAAAILYDTKSGSATRPGLGGGTLRTRRLAVGYSAWEDPVELDVNKITNSVNWRPSTTCTAAGSSTFGYRQSWFIRTGWALLNDNFRTIAECDVVAGRSDGLFFNKNFCDPRKDTYTYIDNRVQGTRDGQARQTWNMVKNGDCAWLLHQEHRVSVTNG